MLEIKIEDVEFAHTVSSCGLPPRHFTWYRGPEARRTCFFTDTALDRVLRSTASLNVAWLLESSVINPRAYRFVRRNLDRFSYVLTHERALVDGHRFLFAPFGGCWVKPPAMADAQGLPPKTKDLSIIASGKTHTKGQKLRHEIIRRFGASMGVYGRGYRPVEFKNEALEEYRFSVVIENGMSDDYFTEKIVDACTLGTVPVYWGSRGIGRHFDAAGILRFENVREFANLLPRLNAETYASMRGAVVNNIERARRYRLAEDWIFEHYPFLFASP